MAIMVLALAAPPASADAGLPMLVVVWPVMWALFVPIVVLEAYVAVRQTGLTWKRSMVASLAANASSTLVGIPLVWFILFGVQLLLGGGGSGPGGNSVLGYLYGFTVQAPWLVRVDEQGTGWMLPAAAGVLLVPFYFMSVFVERIVFAWVGRADRSSAGRWSRTANRLTYGGMLAIALGLAVWGAATHR